MNGNGKSLILSFDDGPAPINALMKILQTLQQNAIKAEFYVLGTEVKQYPSHAKMIVNGGHKIQVHSWEHINLEKATGEVVQSQLGRTRQAIIEATGAYPTKIRPPYGAGGWPGRFDPKLANVASGMSLAIQNWDIDTEDWKSPKGIKGAKINMIENQFNRSEGKSRFNVLMHVQDETAQDLQSFINVLKGWGFTFAMP